MNPFEELVPQENRVTSGGVSNPFESMVPQQKRSLADRILGGGASRFVTNNFAGSKVGESIGTLIGYALSKNKQYYDLSAPNPSQVGGDILRGATQIYAAKAPIAPSFAGKTFQFGTVNALSTLGKDVAEKKSLKQTVQDTATSGLTGMATGAAFGVIENATRGLGNLVKKTGQKIQSSVIKPSSADIRDGFSIDTVNKYGLGGSLQQTLQKSEARINKLTSELNAKLAKSNKTINLNEIFNNTVKRVSGNKLSSFGSNTQMEGALQKLKSEIAAISDGAVSIPDAQTIKKASGHFGAWTYGVPTPEASAAQKVYNTFYNEMKTAIEKASPAGVQNLNKQISELIPVINAVIKRIPVQERNAAISLGDLITAGAAAVDPRAAVLFAINKGSKSGRVGNALTELGTKIGQSKLPQGAERLGRTATGL